MTVGALCLCLSGSVGSSPITLASFLVLYLCFNYFPDGLFTSGAIMNGIIIVICNIYAMGTEMNKWVKAPARLCEKGLCWRWV